MSDLSVQNGYRGINLLNLFVMDIVTIIAVVIIVAVVMIARFLKPRPNEISNAVQINMHGAKPMLPGATQHKFNVLMAALQEAEAPAITDEQITQIYSYFNEINATRREIENELEEVTTNYFNGKISIGSYNQRLDNYLSRINNLKYSLPA